TAAAPTLIRTSDGPGSGIGLSSIFRTDGSPRRSQTTALIGLVELEGVLVVELEGRILVFLLEEAVADHQHLDLAAHEAAEGVLGRAYDRLAAHVERGVDHDRAPGLRLEGRDQVMKRGVGFAMHRLDAARVVDVGHGRNVRAWHVQLVDAE